MSYCIKVSTKRSSIEVPFYQKSAETEEYIRQTYLLTNKKKIMLTTVSEDLLEEISIIEFSSRAAQQEYLNDPVVVAHLDKKNQYNYDNGIITTPMVIVDTV